jgi:hypothetical protein
MLKKYIFGRGRRSQVIIVYSPLGWICLSASIINVGILGTPRIFVTAEEGGENKT